MSFEDTVKAIKASSRGSASEDDTRKAMTEFASKTCEEQAKILVFDYVIDHLDPSDGKHSTFGLNEVYIVSFSYILGNWKALISTSLPDGMYYEVTFDKQYGVVYLDPYKRFDHKEIAIPAAQG